MTQHCSGCGAVIPFEACPTCPPMVYICPVCGAENLVEPAPLDQVEEILKRYKERHP